MEKILVHIPEVMRHALADESAETGAPMAEIIRRALAATLASRIRDLEGSR